MKMKTKVGKLNPSNDQTINHRKLRPRVLAKKFRISKALVRYVFVNFVHSKILSSVNHLPNKPVFLRVCSTCVLKTML